MIRIIVKTKDSRGFIATNGEEQMITRIKSFDIDIPSLENYLKNCEENDVSWVIIGVEWIEQEEVIENICEKKGGEKWK